MGNSKQTNPLKIAREQVQVNIPVEKFVKRVLLPQSSV